MGEPIVVRGRVKSCIFPRRVFYSHHGAPCKIAPYADPCPASLQESRIDVQPNVLFERGQGGGGPAGADGHRGGCHGGAAAAAGRQDTFEIRGFQSAAAHSAAAAEPARICSPPGRAYLIPTFDGRLLANTKTAAAHGKVVSLYDTVGMAALTGIDIAAHGAASVLGNEDMCCKSFQAQNNNRHSDFGWGGVTERWTRH